MLYVEMRVASLGLEVSKEESIGSLKNSATINHQEQMLFSQEL